MLVLKHLAAVIVFLVVFFSVTMTMAQPQPEFVPLDEPPGDPTPIRGAEYLIIIGAITGGYSVYHLSRKKNLTKTQWQQRRL